MMPDIIKTIEYKGYNLVQCQCFCGSTFHALKSEVESGEIKSCGHVRAGNILDRLVAQ
jgi:hypothetical protein